MALHQDREWVLVVFLTLLAADASAPQVLQSNTRQAITRASCPGNQLTCIDGSCVNSNEICDFTPDCSDGGDEKACPLTCNFDTDLCGWTASQPDKLTWERGSGTTTTSIRTMAPQYDSTSSGNGYYVFIHDRTGGKTNGNLAVLTSPDYSSASAECKIQFHYFMHGDSVGPLSLTVTQGGKKATLWQDQGDHESKWQSINVGIGRRNTTFTLTFEAGNVYSYHGIIAIDQLEFEDCGRPQPQASCNMATEFTCLNKACVGLSRKCDLTDDCGDRSDEDDPMCAIFKRYDFENGFGDFIQGKDGNDDSFDWYRWDGSIPSFNFGPDHDHSTGLEAGHYLYMRATTLTYYQKTWLLTKPFNPTIGKYCHMRLYYYIYGQSVNQLNIYTRIYNSGTPTRHFIWSDAGNHGAAWQRADISLNNSRSFQVIIEARTGDSFSGNIAIDDVSFTTGCQYSEQSLSTNPILSVPSQTPTLTPSTLIPPTTAPQLCSPYSHFSCHSTGWCINRVKMCNFQNDCPDGSDEETCATSCDFENGWCGWKNVKGDNLDWISHNGSTDSQGTGPDNDHTLVNKNGHYLYVEASNRQPRDNAILESSEFSQSGPICELRFWYHMYGTTVGTLSVLIRTSQAGDKPMWSKSGDQGNIWHLGRVTVGERRKFAIIFETTLDYGFHSDIAIDDISFLNCKRYTTGAVSHITNVEISQASQLKCLPQGFIMMVDFSKLPSRPVDISYFYIGTQTCTGRVQGDLLIFNRTYDECNTQVQISGGNMTFTNTLFYIAPDLKHINIRCLHPLYANATFEIGPKSNTKTQGSSSGQKGLIDINAFKDGNFKDPLQWGVTPGAPVYVQVTSLTPSNIVMVLDYCEAIIESTNPSDQKSTPLIEKRVERTTKVLIVRNQIARFMFEMFHLPSDSDGVRITCGVHFCDQTDLSPRCHQRCQVNPGLVG